MLHLNEQVLCSAYAAFARGDFDGYLRHCTPGIVFHVPGRNPLAGTYTRDDFMSFARRIAELSGGTFRETVIDVLANDDRGVVLARHDFRRKGIARTYRTVHVYRIEDGKLAEFHEHPEDLYALDEAWS